MPNTTPGFFDRVEALRKHMLLNTVHMAKVLGVSRVTYSGWVSGKPIRAGNAAKVKAKLRLIMAAMAKEDWPQPDVIAMTPLQRFNTLIDRMATPEPE